MIMHSHVHQFIHDIINEAPTGNKEAVIQYAVSRYALTQDRKVFYCQYFAVRFSYSQKGTFSNTVLSLSTLQKYDKIPFFVVLVRNNNCNIVYLANSTFLSKISHSSKELSMRNIKGSFNGSDIIKEYSHIPNTPNNFDELFAIHQGLDWEDNLSRLVESSSNIASRTEKFVPNGVQMQNLYQSIFRAQDFVASEHFNTLTADLNNRCNKCKEAILVASHIENVNIRGRIIEYMITTDETTREKIKHLIVSESKALPEFDTRDALGDYVYRFDGTQTYTDIKTKIIYLDSAPKAYNIDKFLATMSEEDSAFFFFIIGINEDGVYNTALCSVYHNDLIDASVAQHHWAGRATRGVVQFAGKTLNQILTQENFTNVIDEEKAKCFLDMLIAR